MLRTLAVREAARTMAKANAGANASKDEGGGEERQETDFTRKFADLIAKAVRSGKSQSDIGAALGRYQSRVSKWKLGTGAPTPPDIANMVRLFGCTYDYLCDEDVTEPLGVSAFNPARPGDPLTEDERAILKIVRRLGAEAALDRLISAPGDVPHRAAGAREVKP